MTGEHSTVKGSPLEHTGELSESWLEAFAELHERIDELMAANQRLARLTRESYQHSQQVWHRMRDHEERLAGIRSSQDKSVRRQFEILKQLEALAVAQSEASEQISGIYAMLETLTNIAAGETSPEVVRSSD